MLNEGIVIDPVLSKLLPSLRPDERELLEKDIKKNGVQEPLWVWRTKIAGDILLDGHTRLEIANSLDIEYDVACVEGLKTVEDARLWILRHQLERRNADDGSRAILAAQLKELYGAQARKRQATSTGGANPQLTATLPEAEKGEAREKAAKEAGISPRTVQKASNVLKKGHPQLKDMVAAGLIDVSTAEKVAKFDMPTQESIVAQGVEGIKEAAKEYDEKVAELKAQLEGEEPPTPPSSPQKLSVSKQKPRKQAKTASRSTKSNSEGEDTAAPDIGAYKELYEALDTLAIRIAKAKSSNKVTNGLFEGLVSHFRELADMLWEWDGTAPFSVEEKDAEENA